MKNSTQFETVIGYTFQDKSLLEKALTHNSYSKEHQKNRTFGNERLEFLGDAFLDAIIGEELYLKFPKAEEGFLTKVRASLVCERSLVELGRKLNIGQYLHMGKGEERSGGRNRDSIIADAMEAVIGAIYLDSNYETVKGYVLRIFSDSISEVREGTFSSLDHKSHIQELLQAKGIFDIQYIPEKEVGPDHSKIFYMRLEADGKVLGYGKGKSKKEAEQMAAQDSIERRNHVF